MNTELLVRDWLIRGQDRVGVSTLKPITSTCGSKSAAPRSRRTAQPPSAAFTTQLVNEMSFHSGTTETNAANLVETTQLFL